METSLAWDIDGTLVRTVRYAPISLTAYEAAARACGAAPRPLEPTDGKTDAGILAELVGDQLLPAALRAFEGIWPEHLGGAELEALPGTDQALRAALAVGARNICVTGNVPARAQAKLRRVGLDHLIDWTEGAYGDLSTRRGDLVRSVTRPGVRVIVVGDTPADVRAALEADAIAVAVCTGPFDRQTLQDAGATLVIDDLVAGLEDLLTLVETAVTR